MILTASQRRVGSQSHIFQQMVYQRSIQNFKGKAFFAQIFERRAYVVQYFLVDYHKAVVHLCRVLQGERRILSIELLDILRSQFCLGVGINDDSHVFLLLGKAFKNTHVNIVVYQNYLLPSLSNKAFELCVSVKNLPLKEDALRIFYVIFVD
jgi:hypothetical protein